MLIWGELGWLVETGDVAVFVQAERRKDVARMTRRWWGCFIANFNRIGPGKMEYMNKTRTMMAALLICGLILGGCGARSGPAGGSTKESATSKAKTSLGNLLKGGVSQECRYATVDGKNQTLVQVAGNKFYQEVKMLGDDEGTTYAIGDGEWMYIWNTRQPNQGMKFNMSEIEKEGEGAGSAEGQVQSGKVNLNNEVEVECKPWVVDSGKFVAPSNITFIDTSVLVPKPTGAEASGKQMCQYCEMNPDATARAECKKSLGCD